MKRFLSLLLSLCIMCSVAGATMQVSANTTDFSDDLVDFRDTDTWDDDYVYLLMSWNTDDAVLSTTSNSNIQASGVDIDFATRANVTMTKNKGWYNYEYLGVGRYRFYFTPTGLQNTNGKMECVLRADDIPYQASIYINGISSTRSIGGSITFYPCDKDGNKLSDTAMFKLKVGQKTYPATDTVDLDAPYYYLNEMNLTGEETIYMPTSESAVESEVIATGHYNDGLDADLGRTYYSKGNFYWVYWPYIVEGTVTKDTGESIQGVTIENVDYYPHIRIEDSIYDSIGDETSIPLQITLLARTRYRNSDTLETTKSSKDVTATFNTTLERPQVAITKKLKNMTTDLADSQYCRMAIGGKVTADDGYKLPETISVKVGENTLSSSQYTYNSSTGDISIPAEYVKDAVEISALATTNCFDLTSIWTTDADAGYVLDENNQKKGIIRFIFDYSPETNVKVEKSGIMYIVSDDFLGEVDENTSFAGASGTGTSSTFYGDLINIPEEKAGVKYYGVGYALINGTYYWSDPIGSLPDFNKLINY